MSNPRFFGVAHIDHDDRNILILMPFIQTSKNAPVDEVDFEHALVVDLDTVNNDIAEQLRTMANNYHAGEFKTLLDYLEGKSLRNSDRVIAWLHENGQISKIPAKDIRVEGMSGSLRDVNMIVRDQMLDKQPARDVDDVRRKQAREYHEQLSEDVQPPFQEEVTQESSSQPQPESVGLTLNGVKELHQNMITQYRESDDKLSLAMKVVDELKRSIQADPTQQHTANHLKLSESIKESREKLQSALTVAEELRDTLSDKAVDDLKSKLTESVDVSDAQEQLIDALAEYYEYVDRDYIKKTLSSAETRSRNKDETKAAQS